MSVSHSVSGSGFVRLPSHVQQEPEKMCTFLGAQFLTSWQYSREQPSEVVKVGSAGQLLPAYSSQIGSPAPRNLTLTNDAVQ
jgi:hypothetical protein